jgi:hypothetical protein
MAAERAATMATMIQSSWWSVGIPFAASIAPQSANGSANTECSHLIISKVTRRLLRKGTSHSKAMTNNKKPGLIGPVKIPHP